MDSTALIENYSRGLSSDGKTRTLFLRYANDFLEYADGNLSREVISKYMEHLRSHHGYSDGSVNFVFRVIRTMVSRSEKTLEGEGFVWPFRRGDSPQIRESQVQENAPALDPRTIKRMIAAVRQKGEIADKAMLALSTTYGLRKGELIEVSQKEVRIPDSTIHIMTTKHGRERTHVIPEAILPYLKAYNFDTKRTESYIFALWYRMEYLTGLKHIHRVGWHSVRRSLITMLGRELTDLTVKSFVRHKQRTSSDMTYRYSAVKFVGEEEETTEVVGTAYQTDMDAFRVHPFLEYWK